MECLFRYYSYGLERKFRPNIFKDFQEETMKDYEAGEMHHLGNLNTFTQRNNSQFGYYCSSTMTTFCVPDGTIFPI